MKKLNLLISLSNKIMQVHRQLNEYLIIGGKTNDLVCEKLTNKLRIMVAKEQEVLCALDRKVLDKYLEVIDNNYLENVGASRLKDRIIHYQNYNSIYTIDAKSIGFDKEELKDKKFIIADIINTVAMDKAIKILSVMISNLPKGKDDNEKANKLINFLNHELLIYRRGLLRVSTFYEIMFLSFYNNMPEVDLNKIGSAIKNDYRKASVYNNCMEDIISEAFKELKPFISHNWTFKVKYNFEDIFNFLLSLAELEALFPYMSQDLLHELDTLFNRPVTIGRFEFEPVSTREAIKKELKK